MSKFIFVMQHPPTPEQLNLAAEGGREIVRVDNDPAKKALLEVPEDPTLSREWFATRSAEILSAVGGVGDGDVAHVMGQQQLAAATQAAARRAGATLVESCTKRDSKETVQPDGSTKKVNIFIFKGFRTVHEY